MKIGAFIVPTGIGASIGGFAGDASKWARKISKKCKLIVNPNVVNAACFSGITENMLYVEGYALDKFFKGDWCLQESCENKIGVVFDKTISQDVLNIHINTINAVKTVYDINILDYEITEEEVGVNFFIDKTGISTGNVENLETLKKATQKLINKGNNTNNKLKTSEGTIKRNKVSLSISGWSENETDALRSAMSYTNSKNLEEFKESKWVVVMNVPYNK